MDVLGILSYVSCFRIHFSWICGTRKQPTLLLEASRHVCLSQRLLQRLS